MTQTNEPSVKKSACSYCGNAPINHFLSFLDSAIFFTFDNHAKKILEYVPSFLISFVDLVPCFLFNTLVFLKLAKFSDDIDKANNFRSRIIWEEARRRGISMEQIVFLNKPLDYYRATLNGKKIFFESIPIKPESLSVSKNWDDKVILKQEFKKHEIPVPNFYAFSLLSSLSCQRKIFDKLKKPIIIKPRAGSRGRHTVTNINTFEQFRKGVNIAGKICERKNRNE
mgnify:CR=1 FL=1